MWPLWHGAHWYLKQVSKAKHRWLKKQNIQCWQVHELSDPNPQNIDLHRICKLTEINFSHCFQLQVFLNWFLPDIVDSTLTWFPLAALPPVVNLLINCIFHKFNGDSLHLTAFQEVQLDPLSTDSAGCAIYQVHNYCSIPGFVPRNGQ